MKITTIGLDNASEVASMANTSPCDGALQTRDRRHVRSYQPRGDGSLWARGATITAFDPVAMKETQHIYGERADLRYADNSKDALQDADVLIIVTGWKAFKSPDFNTIKARLKQPVIFDGRNLFEPANVTALGIKYRGIGRDGEVI